MFNLLSPDSSIGKFLQLALDVCLITLAFTLCCLPVVTIGAACAAVCKVSQNWVRTEDGCGVKNFFQAFRDNFKNATVMWLILLPCVVLVALDGWLVLLSDIAMPQAAGICLAVGAAALLLTMAYAFPLQVTFENSPVQSLINGFRIGISHLLPTLGILAVYGLGVFFCLLVPVLSPLFVVLAHMFSARPTWWVLRNVVSQLEGTAPSAPAEN